MRISLTLLLLTGLFCASGCALFKKKNKNVAIIDMPIDGIVKYMGDPAQAPVLVIVGEDQKFTQSLLNRGYNLIQVIDDSRQTEFRAAFAEYSDARLWLTDFMQGKMGEDVAYNSVIMDETKLGRPIWIKQNQDMLLTLWTRLNKGGVLFYLHYTEDAKKYGKKESTLLKDQFVELANTKFSRHQLDSTSIPGIHVIKFIK